MLMGKFTAHPFKNKIHKCVVGAVAILIVCRI